VERFKQMAKSAAWARGIMACDWGCTQKVQSRGCAQHAQARWAPIQPGRQFRTT